MCHLAIDCPEVGVPHIRDLVYVICALPNLTWNGAPKLQHNPPILSSDDTSCCHPVHQHQLHLHNVSTGN